MRDPTPLARHRIAHHSAGPRHRYLQQLVSAQATRNRELEAQLSRVRAATPTAGAVLPDDMRMDASEMGMVLHDEVDDAFGLAGVREAAEGDGMDVEDVRGRTRTRAVVVKEETGMETS